MPTEDTFTSGLDLEFESDMPTVAPEPAAYETCYVTSHKGACRSGCFSPDGQLIATGSVDASIKVGRCVEASIKVGRCVDASIRVGRCVEESGSGQSWDEKVML